VQARFAEPEGFPREAPPALRQLGAHEVVVGDDIPPVPKFDLIIESVGGRTLGTALAALERGGVCVTLGVSASPEVTFDTRMFFSNGRATLYGFYMGSTFSPSLGTSPPRKVSGASPTS